MPGPRLATFIRFNLAAFEEYRKTTLFQFPDDTEEEMLQLLEEYVSKAPLEETVFYLALILAVDEGRIETDEDPWTLYGFFRPIWEIAGILSAEVPAFFAIGHDPREVE